MLRLLWRMTRGYRLRPWRSPYLRWRIETYSGLHAETITFGQFWGFVWKSRYQLIRYLRWAASKSILQNYVSHSQFRGMSQGERDVLHT
jgi:hypothetical protein